MPSLLMGSLVLGRVAYSCALDRNEGLFHPSILRLLRDGVTLWVERGFPPTRSKLSFSLDNWSVFLQDGVTLFGSDSNDLISIEGITSVGLLGVFFRAVLGMFGHPVVVRLALKLGGSFHIQLSSLLVRTLCVSLSPTKEWVLALLLLALLPLALPSWVGLLRQTSGVSFTRAFSCAGIPRMVAR